MSALVGMTYGPTLWLLLSHRTADPGILFALLGSALLAVLVPLLPLSLGKASYSGPEERYLRTCTLTGWRTIDLASVIEVRRWPVTNPVGRTPDILFIRDAHGVRLGIGEDSPVVHRLGAAVHDTLRRYHRPGPPSVRISRSARLLLPLWGLDPRSYKISRDRHVLLESLALFVILIIIYLVSLVIVYIVISAGAGLESTTP